MNISKSSKINSPGGALATFFVVFLRRCVRSKSCSMILSWSTSTCLESFVSRTSSSGLNFCSAVGQHTVLTQRRCEGGDDAKSRWCMGARREWRWRWGVEAPEDVPPRISSGSAWNRTGGGAKWEAPKTSTFLLREPVSVTESEGVRRRDLDGSGSDGGVVSNSGESPSTEISSERPA